MTKPPVPTMRMMSDEEVEALDIDNLPIQDSIQFDDFNDISAEFREQLLIQLIEQNNDPEVMLALTDLYILELDQPQKAKVWLDKMLALDYTPAYLTQAQMYMYGKYFERDLNKATELFEQQIERYIQQDSIEENVEHLIFCYLSLAQISQMEEDIAQMFGHYFNALQLSSQEAASSLARIFSPEATDDPVYKPQVCLLHCALLSLNSEFLHQQYQETEDPQLKQMLALNHQAMLQELEEIIDTCGLTAEQRQQINLWIEAWNQGEPEVLMDAMVNYING